MRTHNKRNVVNNISSEKEITYVQNYSQITFHLTTNASHSTYPFMHCPELELYEYSLHRYI